MDFCGFSFAYWNPDGGWAEAGRALERVVEAAVAKGTEFVTGRVLEIMLAENDDKVSGVRLVDGRELKADKVVLATGAWTPQLMWKIEEKLGICEMDRVKSQVSAAGVAVASLKLEKAEAKLLEEKSMPVIVYGANGEIIPPTAEKGIGSDEASIWLKFTNATSFANTVSLDNSTARMSIPSSKPQSEVPAALKAEVLELIRRQMPSLLRDKPDREISWRLCWDAITQTQDPLITAHPDFRLKNLVLAIGGSFHWFKFLPICGQWVANVVMEEGNGPERDRRWHWKSDNSKLDESGGEMSLGAHEKLLPRRQLADLG
jgi:sarcosine oxidase/L-pipecolate oxidase